jgi:hypothetical protein
MVEAVEMVEDKNGSHYLLRCLIGLLCVASISAPSTIALAETGVSTSSPAEIDPHVELLTVDPGVPLYARFGHTALVVHRKGKAPKVYNFGFTRFGDSRLILKVLTGKAIFWLLTRDLPRMLKIYEREDRRVVSQILNISAKDHQRLADLLASFEPADKREYIYHHFYENCSTRLRDLMDKITGGAIADQLKGKITSTKHLRQVVRDHVAVNVWVLFFADLLFGRTIDHPIDQWVELFLPAWLQKNLMTVTVDGKNLVSAKMETLRLRQGPPLKTINPYAAVHLLWGLVAGLLLTGALMTFGLRKNKRFSGLLLLFPTTVFGLLAILLWTVAIYASVPLFRQNELVAVLWPTDILLVGIAIRWMRGRFFAGRLFRGYAYLRAGILVIVLGLHAVGVLIQRPIAWPITMLVFALGLVAACRVLPQKAPVASATNRKKRRKR